MKRFKHFDLGILAALALCGLALWPFLSRPGLPADTDAELHIFRTVELYELIRGGAVYPRWAPDFYFGYGYPIFNYYAPLVYYVAVAFMFLLGVGAAVAVKLVFVTGILLAGLGMYCFVRRLWGPPAGLLAAALYVYAPYVQFIDPLARGVLAESFSLALFPWTLWAFARLGASRRSRNSLSVRGLNLVLAAVSLGALICSHNLMALVFTAVLLVWQLWLALWAWRDAPRDGRTVRGLVQKLIPAATAALLGLGLAAFFWLPVFLERNAVQLGNVISTGGHFDFHNHFLQLGELIGTTVLNDLGAVAARYMFNAGLLQWVTALAAGASVLLLWRRLPGRVRVPVGFFAVAALGLIFLVLPVSSPVWERVPFLPFLQFPWRLLGPLAACLAILGASLVPLAGVLPRPVWLEGKGHWLLAIALAAILVAAIPLTFLREWPADFGPTSLEAINRYERQGRWLGTTSTGDYLPVAVNVVPAPIDQMIENYRREESVDRVNRATLPVGTQVTQTSALPLSWKFAITGTAPFILRIYHFHFPGWTASLDGNEAPITEARPEGFMTVEVPAGEHTVTLAFQDTLARSLGWAVSALALTFCVLFLWRADTRRDESQPIPQISRPVLVASLAVPLLLLLFRQTLVEPLGWFRYESAGLIAEPADTPVFYQVADEIGLIGYQWRPANPGGTAELDLYWKALEPIDDRYQVFVHLRNEAGQVVSQSDKLNPGDYPTSLWPLDGYIHDAHRLQVPAELAAGEYRVMVGIWNMASGQRLPVYNEAGDSLGDSITLQTIHY